MYPNLIIPKNKEDVYNLEYSYFFKKITIFLINT